MDRRFPAGPSKFYAALSESDFLERVVDRARARGWLVHHDRGDYRACIAGDPGFPDLVLARGGVVVFAELKSETGRVTEAQTAWLDSTGGHLWRPSQWPAICDLLDGETGR